MQQPDFDIDRVYYAIEAKDNNYKIRIDMENLNNVYTSFTNLVGDNLDLFLNKLKYAYKVLVNNFLSWMDKWNDSDQLVKILEIFIDYTKSQSELHTGGIKNTDLKIFAYYGLHAVEFIKGEYDSCMKCILQAYIINPRIARYKLYYNLYELKFLPLISYDIKMDLAFIKKEKSYMEFRNLSVEQMRDKLDLLSYRLEEIEQKIDYQCQWIAEQALKEMETRGVKL